MKTPDEFSDICGQFHADIHLHCQSIDEMVRFSLNLVDQERARVAHAFLDALLSGRYSEDELQEIWQQTPADIYFPKPEELVAVLTTMRTMLAEKLGPTE